MRQTSTAFMDEMLKDNSNVSIDKPDLSKQIAETIDKKMEQAMKKYTEQISKLNTPTSEESNNADENINNSEEDSENEESGEEVTGESSN